MTYKQYMSILLTIDLSIITNPKTKKKSKTQDATVDVESIHIQEANYPPTACGKGKQVRTTAG